MSEFRRKCRENGIEKYNTVEATVCDFNSQGTYVTIDGTDLISFYYGGTAKRGSKVLIRIEKINDERQRIASSLDSVTEYAA